VLTPYVHVPNSLDRGVDDSAGVLNYARYKDDIIEREIIVNIRSLFTLVLVSSAIQQGKYGLGNRLLTLYDIPALLYGSLEPVKTFFP
jgi:hypothetical protein